MNEIVKKFLLAGDKFMPEMHLKQPRFTQSAYGAFTKDKERIQKFKETGDTSAIFTKLNLIRFAFNTNTLFIIVLGVYNVIIRITIQLHNVIKT